MNTLETAGIDLLMPTTRVASQAGLVHGDCLEVLRLLPDCSVDSIVTDPPYGLSFMGKRWDYDVPSVEVWAECLRVLKPGGHLLAFAGTRTQHRMAVRIEDAGFEIRDMIAWVYGSGFPKSLDVSKAIDKAAPRAGMFDVFAAHFAERLAKSGKTQKEVAALFPSKTGGITGCVWNWANGANVPTLLQWRVLQPLLGLSLEWLPLIERIEAERDVVGQQRGTRLAVAPGQDNDRSETALDITAPATDAARQWQGWGTALKPALEPITVARKPLIGTVAANVLAHGTGALNIEDCRVGDFVNTTPSGVDRRNATLAEMGYRPGAYQMGEKTPNGAQGRWPANLIHDGSDEVLAGFPETTSNSTGKGGQSRGIGFHGGASGLTVDPRPSDTGSAARFFYCAKASKRDRDEGLDGFPLQSKAHIASKDGGGCGWAGDAEKNPNLPRANVHPTVKPTDLMAYLCRLVTPPGGTVLDPFMGSGSTGKAAMREGFRFIGIEMDAAYLEIARARILHAAGGDLA